MRIQQMLFVAFACSVLLIGCSKPVEVKAYDQTTIVDHDHEMISTLSVSYPVVTEALNPSINNDSHFSFETLNNQLLLNVSEWNQPFFNLNALTIDESDTKGFKLSTLNGNHYLSLKKAIQTFHREEEIKINGELLKLNSHS